MKPLVSACLPPFTAPSLATPAACDPASASPPAPRDAGGLDVLVTDLTGHRDRGGDRQCADVRTPSRPASIVEK